MLAKRWEKHGSQASKVESGLKAERVTVVEAGRTIFMVFGLDVGRP